MNTAYKFFFLGLLSVVLGSVSLAADFPNRPVRLVVPFTAGGTLDVTARVIAAKLHDIWGQSVIVDNRVGGNGAIGADHVVRSPADGYTLLYNGSLIVVTQQLQKTTFDMTKDLVPVVQPVVYWHVLCVSPKLPVNSFTELVELAKKQPGKLNYGSGGLGSSLHLYMERLKSNLKLDIAHIPYKGSAPATQALLAGEVDIVFDTTSAMLPLIKAGKVKPLVVTGDKRMEVLSNVPTLTSLIPGMAEEPGWHGIFAPAGTPKAVADKIAADVRAAVMSVELSTKFKEMEFQPSGLQSDAFAEVVKKDFDKWSKLIRENNIRGE